MSDILRLLIIAREGKVRCCAGEDDAVSARLTYLACLPYYLTRWALKAELREVLMLLRERVSVFDVRFGREWSESEGEEGALRSLHLVSSAPCRSAAQRRGLVEESVIIARGG